MSDQAIGALIIIGILAAYLAIAAVVWDLALYFNRRDKEEQEAADEA